jgi:Tol biopolymer transport system component
VSAAAVASPQSGCQAGSDRQVQQASIELLDLTRATQCTIVKRTGWAGEPEGPAISDDGRTLVYTNGNSWLAKPAGAAALYTVRSDGSGNRRIIPWKLGNVTTRPTTTRPSARQRGRP